MCFKSAVGGGDLSALYPKFQFLLHNYEKMFLKEIKKYCLGATEETDEDTEIQSGRKWCRMGVWIPSFEPI